MALINCSECGAQISDAASACPRCGAPLKKVTYGTTSQQSMNTGSANVCPETHLAKAIVVTLLCCWPVGVPAIINAAGVSSAFAAGNYQEAVQKSEKANKWSNYCIIAGVVFWLIYIAFIIVVAVVGAADIG